MNRSHHVAGAHISPIIAVVVALVALLAVLLLLNPPQVVDGPTTPDNTPPVADETPVDDTPDTNNNPNNNDTPNEVPETPDVALGDPSADCAKSSSENNDGVWRAQMNDETQAIMEDILALHGGIDHLTALCTVYGEGISKLTAQGQTIDSQVQLWLRIPNQVRNLVKVPLGIPGQFFETLVVWEGSTGWTKAFNPDSLQFEVSELPAELMVQAIEEIELHPVLSLLAVQDSGASFTYLGTEHEANEGAIAIQFRTELGSSGIFFYDPQTFETVSLFREGGGRTVEKLYTGYDDVSGYHIPHQITTVLTDPNVGEVETMLIYETLTINSDLDPVLFTEPEA